MSFQEAIGSDVVSSAPPLHQPATGMDVHRPSVFGYKDMLNIITAFIPEPGFNQCVCMNKNYKSIHSASRTTRFKNTFITSTKEAMFSPEVVCLSVCLIVSNITRKVVDGFG